MEFLLMMVILHASCVHQGLQGAASKNWTNTSKTDELMEKQSGLQTPILENCSGTLLALHHGRWVTVNLTQRSDETKKDLTQLCNDLGCGRILAENATASMNTCQSNCTIIHSSLYSCGKASTENCSSVIEVVCEWQAVQLIGGKDRCAGRVELFGTGGWGTVCDDGWDLNGGNVVCAQLGCGTALWVMGENSDFVSGSGPIHISHLNCSGTEKNLWQCTGLKRDKNYCGHKEDAAVVCSGSSFRPLTTIKPFTADLTNCTTEIVTAVEDKSGEISAPVLGCIFLSVTLFLLLFSNAAQCAYYKRRIEIPNGRFQTVRTSQASQQDNSDSSSNSSNDYERYCDPDSLPPATVNNFEHAPALDSGSTSSGECYENTENDNLLNPVIAQLHPEYCIQMTPLHNTSETAKIDSEDLFDSDSTSSGECYENAGPCLATKVEGDPSLPEQPSLGFPKPQMEGNSTGAQPNNSNQAPVLHSESVAEDSFDSESTSSEDCYENIAEEDPSFPEQHPLSHTKPQLEGNSSVPQTHDEDGSSTSSEEAYEIVAEIDANRFAGSERSVQSASDSDYDDVCNW